MSWRKVKCEDRTNEQQHSTFLDRHHALLFVAARHRLTVCFRAAKRLMVQCGEKWAAALS
jgi:hypothetical protein